jgi:hypothetical protein
VAGHRRPVAGIVGFLALAVAAPPASRAATYVPVPDGALVDQAALVVVGRVVGRRPAAGEPPATAYEVAVERTVKGAAADRVLVRVLGGTRPDGRALWIAGAPAFGTGERVLLFLEPRGDAGYRILHLALGAFRVVVTGGRAVAVRDLTGLREVRRTPGGLAAGPAGPDRPRDLERFARWAADRAAGRHRPPDYVVEPSGAALRRLTGAFTLFTFVDVFLRWFTFDASGAVPFHAHVAGQDGLAGGGFAEFQAALAAWNGDPGSLVNYTYGGTTTAAAGFLAADGVNTILFNDPNNELGSFSCGGGILAIAGPWFDPGATGLFNGLAFHPVLEADVITNDGLACFFAASPDAAAVAEELFGHELGHTLGIGHSCDENGGTEPPSCASNPTLNQALMRWHIHDDGRGASLNTDDQLAVRALYGPTTLAFFTLTPCRLLDTRAAADLTGGLPLVSGHFLVVPASGKCGIPASARALSLNVTAAGPTAPGHLTLFAPRVPSRPPARSTSAPGRRAPTTRSSWSRPRPAAPAASGPRRLWSAAARCT